jgi:thioredoxin reductase
MAVDTPATIAILGAGPSGLEAALYARFLGYAVVIFERGRVGEHLRQWGHVRMFSPFGMNCSPLALAALAAQDESWQPPADDALLTGGEFVARYLEPLAATDLLSDHIRVGHEVLAVGRENFLKEDAPGSEDRGAFDFRLLARDAEGREYIEQADVVIDTTGVFGQSNWLGSGGIPAPGERAARSRIEYRLPDILGERREDYAGRHTLVIGSGFSAATNVVALARLAREAPGTRVSWITRREPPAGQPGPIRLIENDRLSARQELAIQANALCEQADSPVEYWPATDVEAIRANAEASAFQVEVSGERNGMFPFDRIIANVGFRPDALLYRELQIHQCYASEGPMKLAAALLGSADGDCLDQTSHGPQTLLNPEPHFYILGHKSYGRNSSFLLSIGLRQIVEAFTIIGDRPTLDLYAGVGAGKWL